MPNLNFMHFYSYESDINDFACLFVSSLVGLMRLAIELDPPNISEGTKAEH